PAGPLIVVNFLACCVTFQESEADLAERGWQLFERSQAALASVLLVKLLECGLGLFGLEHVSASRQHGQTDEGDPAVRLDINLSIELALLLLIDDNEIEAVLERLQGCGHGSLRVHLLFQVAAARVDLALDHTL